MSPTVTAYDDAAAKTFRMKRRRVASKRNSHMSVPPEWLDWTHWWTDGNTYLHVQGNVAADPDGKYHLKDRVFRVYPRMKDGETSRIEFNDGVLWWLIP